MEHPENDSQYKGLQVNGGVISQPTVNPYLKFRPLRRRELTPADYVDGIVKGNVSILGQAVTLVESIADRHQAVAQEVIEKCLPYAGESRRIGITGVPGAGKSTSIDVFGLHVIRQGHRLAVLAIDPSSERTQGSILGDKTRMEKLSQEKDAFIRPSPSAGSLGGVARKTRETIDFFLLIQLAGTGDELQGIKRGIMEMADGIAINKCDGDNVERAKLAAAQFRNALHLFPPTPSKWVPEVLTYSGYFELDIDKVWDMIDRYFDYVKKTGYFDLKRQQQAKYWMVETIDEQLRSNFYHLPEVRALLEQKEMRVLNNEQSSFTAAKDVLDFYFERLRNRD